MSWSVILKADDSRKQNSGDGCHNCAHFQGCNVAKIASYLGHILTAVDKCEDGTFAVGTAYLNCHGYKFRG